MTSITNNAKMAERLSRHAFGHSLEDHQRTSYALYPMAYINEAKRIVERPSIVDALDMWDKTNRKARRKLRPLGAPTGRAPIISLTALLVVMLIHIREGRGAIFTEMAETLTHRMNAERLRAVGIDHIDGTYSEWYARLLNAKGRLEELLDPLPGPRKKIPTVEQYQRIVMNRKLRAAELSIRKKRLDWLMNQLVESSVLLLGKEVLDRYAGNVALDATKFRMQGALGVSRKPLLKFLLESGLSDVDDGGELVEVAVPRDGRLIRSVSYDAGAYSRDGTHDGTNLPSSKTTWALELELATMTANTPGEAADFPLLSIGVSCHRPGAIRLEGKLVFESLQRRGYPSGKAITDLAYLPNSRPEDLQGVLRDMGRDMVFDYKSTQLGVTTYYLDLVQVEGQWYVNYLPEELRNSESTYRQRTRKENGARLVLPDDERAQLAKDRKTQREAREPYRLKPKGRVRPDGSQQFLYPDAGSYMAFDANTGEMLEPATKRTVVIPREIGLKFGQKYVYRSEKWKAWYGLRSTVEAQNAYLKDPIRTDMEAPGLRRARGNTFGFIVVTLVVVAANVRKIVTFLETMKRGTAVTSSNRYERQAAEPSNLVIEPMPALESRGFDPPPE